MAPENSYRLRRIMLNFCPITVELAVILQIYSTKILSFEHCIVVSAPEIMRNITSTWMVYNSQTPMLFPNHIGTHLSLRDTVLSNTTFAGYRFYMSIFPHY